MKFGVIMLWALACVLAWASAKAVATGSAPDSYQAIVERNVFDLHPPAANIAAEPARQAQQIPKLTLNGITTILGRKLAILTVPPSQSRTPQQTVMLAEGQAQDEVEVEQIDEKSGTVNVINHGEEQTLDFERDGAQPAPSAANPASPGVLQIPPMPPPSFNPGANVIRPLRTLQSLPSRSISPYGKQFWQPGH